MILAPSTKLLLGGRTPAQFAPALQNKRIKRDIVRDEKLKKYPDGLDLKGKVACLRPNFCTFNSYTANQHRSSGLVSQNRLPETA